MDDLVELLDDQIALLDSPIVAESPDAIVAIDGFGRVISVNSAAVAMLGYAEDDAVGKEVAELIVPPRLRDAHRVALQRLRDGSPPILLGKRVEMPALRADGTEVPVELGLTRLSADPLVVVGTMRDVSARRWREQTLADIQALLHEIEHSRSLGTWTWDPDSGDVTWSDGLKRIYGYEPGSVEPSYALAVHHIHPDDREQALEASARFRADGSPPWLLEHRIIRADGRVRDVISRTVAAVQGPPDRLLGIFEDVTVRRAAERERDTYLAVARAISDWRAAEDGSAELLGRVAAALGCIFGAIWLPGPQTSSLICRGTWGADGDGLVAFEAETRALKLAPGRGLPGRTWQQRSPIVVERIQDEPAALRRMAAERAELVSVVAFPAIRGDSVLAVLEFYARDRREPTVHLMDMLTGLGYALGHAIEHSIGVIEKQLLSKREREILVLAAEGLSTSQIAGRLVLSPETVKTHFGRIYSKLEVADRAAAVATGLRRGYIE